MSNISTSAKRPKGSPPLPCSEMWLFPSIAAEKREERSAAAREAVQVVREEKRKAVAWLRKRNLTWLIDKLVDGGPATEISLMFAAANEMSSMEEGAPVLMDVWALWRIGKLWRKSKGRHFGSGEETFLYGLRKVHSQNVATEATASTKL